MLFVTWVADPFRPTRDLDFLGYGENSPEAIGEVLQEICGQPVDDDGVVFDIGAITAVPIREDVEYGGIRVRTSATIAGARIPIQVDIGFGDAVTPGPVEIVYPPLLDAPAPHLRAYPVTTVVAEKFQALVLLGIANSRMKDFYDLWLIGQTFEFDRASLADAVRQTFMRRGTMLPIENRPALSDAYAEAWGRQWQAFLGRERMAAAPAELAVVVSDLAEFLLPLIEPAEGDEHWKPGEGWRASDAGQDA